MKASGCVSVKSAKARDKWQVLNKEHSERLDLHATLYTSVVAVFEIMLSCILDVEVMY
jgi:hypothetical protein